jgi:simple sugar transport system permease protein
MTPAQGGAGPASLNDGPAFTLPSASPSPEHDRSLARRTAGWWGWLVRRSETGAFVGTILVYVFFAIVATNSGFLSSGGTAAWLDVCAELGILAIPVAMLMIAGEFDLSIGSVLISSSLIVAIGNGYEGVPLGLCVMLAFGVAVVVGLLNGFLVIWTGLPSFIVTLGTQFILNGLALGFSRHFTGTTTVGFDPGGWLQKVFGTSRDNFNVSIVWWMALLVLGFWVLEKTAFGNQIFATGGDVNGARNAGVRTNRIKVSLFVATATCASLVGVIQAMEYNGASVVQGLNWEFKTIIAVVIGGVLLTGGYGSVIGAFLGTLTYGIADLGIFYTGWNTDWFNAFLGALLLAAVLTNNFLRRKAMMSR